jgi:polyisoprenoid-binding protein YceI
MARVTGDLTLKGVTRPVTPDVTFAGETDARPFAKAPAIGFSAAGTFKRSEFGLDDLLPSIVGDALNVQIEGDFIQKPAA